MGKWDNAVTDGAKMGITYKDGKDKYKDQLDLAKKSGAGGEYVPLVPAPRNPRNGKERRWFKRNRARLDARDAAAEALNYAKWNDARDRDLAIEQDDRALAFSEEQFAYAKGLDERNFARANEQDARRDGIVKTMLAEAEVSDGELSNRVNDASSDVTRSFEKARGMTSRKLARFGFNPADGRFSATVKDNERDLVAADVAARNSVRTGVRGEEKAGRRGARLASLGLTDTSLRLNNNQLRRGQPGVNSTELGLTDRTGRQLSNISSNAYSLAGQELANARNKGPSGFGQLVQAGMTIAGAVYGGPAGMAAGAAIGGAATGGGGGGGYYGGGRVAPGGSFVTPGAEGTGFNTY